MTGGDAEIQEQQDRDDEGRVWYLSRDRGLTEFYDIAIEPPTHTDEDGDPIYGHSNIDTIKQGFSLESRLVHEVFGIQVRPGYMVPFKVFTRRAGRVKRLPIMEDEGD